MGIVLSEVIGAVFVLIFGTLFHFFYEFSNKNKYVGLISPVNESTWEHLKMIYFPSVIYLISQIIFFGDTYENLLTAKAFGIVIGMLTILALYYAYTAATGRNYLVADILTFVFGIIAMACFTIIYVERGEAYNFAAVTILIVLLFSFIIYTYHPLNLSLFKDPSQE